MMNRWFVLVAVVVVLQNPLRGEAPVAITLPVSALTDSTATLNGSIAPNGEATTAYFEFGPGPGFGLQTTPTNFTASGKSMVFNAASNTYVQVADPLTNRLEGVFSLEAWVFPTVSFCNTIISRENDFIF